MPPPSIRGQKINFCATNTKMKTNQTIMKVTTSHREKISLKKKQWFKKPSRQLIDFDAAKVKPFFKLKSDSQIFFT